MFFFYYYWDFISLPLQQRRKGRESITVAITEEKRSEAPLWRQTFNKETSPPQAHPYSESVWSPDLKGLYFSVEENGDTSIFYKSAFAR